MWHSDCHQKEVPIQVLPLLTVSLHLKIYLFKEVLPPFAQQKYHLLLDFCFFVGGGLKKSLGPWTNSNPKKKVNDIDLIFFPPTKKTKNIWWEENPKGFLKSKNSRGIFPPDGLGPLPGVERALKPLRAPLEAPVVWKRLLGGWWGWTLAIRDPMYVDVS